MPQDTFTREQLLEALTIEPCHITGTHDPDHTIKYICRDQEHVALARLLDLLGVAAEELPRRLGESCGWCQRDSGDKSLLEAWAARELLEFEVRWLRGKEDGSGFDELTHPELFESYNAAWEYACRARGDRKFDIHLRIVGETDWHRVGYWR